MADYDVEKMFAAADRVLEQIDREAAASGCDAHRLLHSVVMAQFDRLIEQGLLIDEDPSIDAVTRAMATIAGRAKALAEKR